MSTVTLKKPVIFMGDTITSLTFTEPTGTVIADCGVPFRAISSRYEQDRGTVDTKAVRNLAIACAGVEPEVIDMLSAKDFLAVIGVVLGFFGDTESAAPNS